MLFKPFLSLIITSDMMAPRTVHLVFAKFPSPGSGLRVRGTEFKRKMFSRIVGSGKYDLIVEDNYTGDPRVYAQKDIRTNPALQRALETETRTLREFVSDAADDLKKGSPRIKHFVISHPEILDRVAAINSERNGAVSFHLTNTDAEAQIGTLEAMYWRNQGYLRAFQHNDPEAAIELLTKSIKMMARVLAYRDRLVVEQAVRLDGEAIILLGSNHRNIAHHDWNGSEVRSYVMEGEPFPYYDEMLIRLTGTDRPSEDEIRKAMKKELVFNLTFIQLLQSTQGEYVEDVMGYIRHEVEHQN